MTSVSIARVTLFISCEGFPFQSSMQAILEEPRPKGGPKVLGTTEAQHWAKQVTFNTPLHVEYFFEMRQAMRLLLVHEGEKTPFAHVDFFLSQVMTASKLIKVFTLTQPALATVTITAVDHSVTREDLVTLSFAAEHISGGLCGKPSVYFKLFRILPTGQRILLHQSAKVADEDPSWGTMAPFRLAELMNRDATELTLDFCCYTTGIFSDNEVGHIKLSVDQLQQAAGNQARIALKKTANGDPQGYLKVQKCDILRSATLVGLLSAGWQVNMIVSIDFTASNGDPRDPKSLHYFNLAAPNEYLRTIRSVGDILLEYDTDKMVPAYGYGAELPDRKTSQFFNLNLQSNPYLAGIDGVIEAYRNALTVVRLSGPSNFAPTIRNVLHGVQQAERDRIYTILLIITDGEIADIDDTIDLLVQADDAALSIIIVGVGSDCDFQAMVQLDGDDGPLVSTKGRKSRRDLVQFVPMKDFINRPVNHLAAEVLREIPAQIERWAALKSIQLEC